MSVLASIIGHKVSSNFWNHVEWLKWCDVYFMYILGFIDLSVVFELVS